MKIKKLGALLVSAALCAGMAAPAFAFEGEAAPVEQPVLPEVVEKDVVTVTDETSGALTPEGNLTLVDDYHTNYSDGSGQQFITLVSKSGNTFYLVIDRNAKGQQTVHFMNLVDEADLLALTRTLAHGPSRPAAPITTFLVGITAGRGESVEGNIERLTALAEAFDIEEIPSLNTLLTQRGWVQRRTTSGICAVRKITMRKLSPFFGGLSSKLWTLRKSSLPLTLK